MPSSPESAAPVRVGEIVAGKYRVEQPIGSGGMGVVMSATHLQLGQLVALKFVRPSAHGDRVIAERFVREARASFRLRSENTVRVLDVGELPSGIPFMVMELLQGHDLRELLTQRGPLPEAEAVEYVLQACAALQEAHAHGIVHRDLKPRNLFLTRRVDGSPCVKVLDFGISKVPVEDAGAEGPLTSPEIALGSPRYMAPEQWKASSDVDARADIYALGMILYELMTGALPLRDLPLGELLRRLVAGALPSPREVRPSISEGVSKVVLKALRPHPDERYASASLLAEALKQTRAPQRFGAPISSTGATAIRPNPMLPPQATPTDRPPPTSPLDQPATRREIPVVAPHEAYDADISTLVSKGVDPSPNPSAARKHASTLQSSAVPPEVEAALRARAQPAPVEEVRFDDPTTVDPPRALQAMPLSQPSPIVSPAAASVEGAYVEHHPSDGRMVAGQHAPAQPFASAPSPVAVPAHASQPRMPQVRAGSRTAETTRTAAVPRGLPTWAWVVIVLVGGFLIGGALAFVIATRT